MMYLIHYIERYEDSDIMCTDSNALRVYGLPQTRKLLPTLCPNIFGDSHRLLSDNCTLMDIQSNNRISLRFVSNDLCGLLIPLKPTQTVLNNIDLEQFQLSAGY